MEEEGVEEDRGGLDDVFAFRRMGAGRNRDVMVVIVGLVWFGLVGMMRNEFKCVGCMCMYGVKCVYECVLCVVFYVLCVVCVYYTRVCVCVCFLVVAA